jgi:hypothetical protein
MWQDLFRRADLITRLSQSPWSPYLDEFAAFLSEQHYSTGTIRRDLVSADHFACWLSERQLSLSDTSATIVAQYRDSLGCPSGSRPERGPLPFHAGRSLSDIPNAVATQPTSSLRRVFSLSARCCVDQLWYI